MVRADLDLCLTIANIQAKQLANKDTQSRILRQACYQKAEGTKKNPEAF